MDLQSSPDPPFRPPHGSEPRSGMYRKLYLSIIGQLAMPAEVYLLYLILRYDATEKRKFFV